MDSEAKTQFHCWIPLELHRALKIAAIERDTTLGALVEHALRTVVGDALKPTLTHAAQARAYRAAQQAQTLPARTRLRAKRASDSVSQPKRRR